MPVELDFWAESLNRNYRKKYEREQDGHSNHNNTTSQAFSIFEDR